jgi:hypothetical protein
VRDGSQSVAAGFDRAGRMAESQDDGAVMRIGTQLQPHNAKQAAEFLLKLLMARQGRNVPMRLVSIQRNEST